MKKQIIDILRSFSQPLNWNFVEFDSPSDFSIMTYYDGNSYTIFVDEKKMYSRINILSLVLNQVIQTKNRIFSLDDDSSHIVSFDNANDEIEHILINIIKEKMEDLCQKDIQE